MTAITLSQITAAFLTAHINKENRLDYTNSTLYLKLIQLYVDAVGEAFLDSFNPHNNLIVRSRWSKCIFLAEYQSIVSTDVNSEHLPRGYVMF